MELVEKVCRWFGSTYENKLYDRFYTAWSSHEIGIEASKSMSGDLAIARNVAGIATLVLGGAVRQVLKNEERSRRKFIREFISYGALLAAGTGYTVHFHEASKIFGQMYRKNMGKELTQDEIESVERDGQIGRAAHYVGVTSTVVAISERAIRDRRYFLFSAPFFAITPFWLCTLDEAYSGLYNSAVDYTVDKGK